MIKVHILTENIAGKTFLAEHGLSYLIEIDGEKILFDTGHSDVFLKNALKLGFDIESQVEQVVLSHGHWDHGNGLIHLENKKLLTHPGAFVKRYSKRDHSYNGLNLSKVELESRFRLTTSSVPVKITPGLWYLGEIPRKNDFENQSTSFELEDFSDDFLPDDSALAAVENNELVIISGCSHSGICNICEYAKEVTGISKIKAVMGGLHLKEQNDQTLRTIDYFAQNKVETIIPSHCTDLPALSAFFDAFKIPSVKTGMSFTFEN